MLWTFLVVYVNNKYCNSYRKTYRRICVHACDNRTRARAYGHVLTTILSMWRQTKSYRHGRSQHQFSTYLRALHKHGALIHTSTEARVCAHTNFTHTHIHDSQRLRIYVICFHLLSKSLSNRLLENIIAWPIIAIYFD